ncbi:MAG: hypothetical protein IJD22_04590 [Clostridia bacterium]|nr:hypothetical protein [Clostridia bacterium]
MRKLSLFLAVLMIAASVFTLASCKANVDVDVDGEVDVNVKNEKIDPKDADLKYLVAAIEEKAPFTDMVSEFLYKTDDPDEMIKWTYGVRDMAANDLIEDYVITMPADYSQTLAIIKFKDGMTEDDFEQVKAAVTEEYISGREKSLFVYMPNEADDMAWALENPDKIWRQYGDNLLVLAIYGDGGPGKSTEAVQIWKVIDDYLAGK